MNRPRWTALVLVGTIAVGCHRSGAPNPELRSVLLSRASQDQRDMQDLAVHWTDSSYHKKLGATLVANAVWLDSVVASSGWPGYARVDSGGTAAAFLIAQHADSTPVAQRRFLVALRSAVAAKDARPTDLAYLEDRIRKEDGRPQLYGTQPAYDDSGLAIQPAVEAPDSLDIRRKAVGLSTMAEYLNQMRVVNAQLRAQQVKAPK